jgi:hypothetical protein
LIVFICWAARSRARSARETSMSAARSTHLGQHVHAVGQHLAESPEAGEPVPDRALAIGELAQAEQREERGVARQHAEEALAAGAMTSSTSSRSRRPSGVTTSSAILVGSAMSPCYSWNFLAASNTSSMAPTRKKACSGMWSSSPFTIILKLRMLSAERHVLARDARELLGDVEGLRQEALDLARARHRDLVVLGQLVDAQDGDDVLQVLVLLEDLLHRARDVVVLLPDHARVQDAREEASGSTAG